MGEPNQSGTIFVNYYCILCNIPFGINVGNGAYNNSGTSTIFCPNCTDALKKVINREKTILNI